MDVQRPEPRNVEEFLGEEVAVGCSDHQVGLHIPQTLQKVRFVRLDRTEHHVLWNSPPHRSLRHGAGRRRARLGPPSTARSTRLADHRMYLEGSIRGFSGVQDSLERGRSHLGCPEEHELLLIPRSSGNRSRPNRGCEHRTRSDHGTRTPERPREVAADRGAAQREGRHRVRRVILWWRGNLRRGLTL